MASLISSNLTRRGFLGAAGAAAAAGVLAGCSSSNGNGSNASNDSNASNGASSGDKAKLSFCLDYAPNTNHTGLYVAQNKGYFDDEGLDVEIVQPGDSAAEDIIGSGSSQFGISAQDTLANSLATDSPKPLAAIAAIIQHDTSGIMSRKEDGITHFAALEGHKYTTWNLPIEQAQMKYCVEKDGGDWSKVTLVPYETDDDLGGLRANMYDAVWVFEGWAVQQAAVQNVDINYFSFRDTDDIFDYYTPVIIGNTDYMSQNPDVTKAFLRAIKKGYEYAVDNPDDAADILLQAVPELDSALVKQSQSYLSKQYTADASSWGVIDPNRWKAYYQWLNDNKLVDKQLDVNGGYDTQYLEA